MRIKIEKLPAKTYKVSVTVEKDKVTSAFNQAFNDLKSNISVGGFRKGMAPDNLIKEKADPSKLTNKVLTSLIPNVYSAIIKEHHLHPIIDPKIQVENLKEDEEAKFLVTIVEYPEVELENYKENIKNLKPKKTKSKNGNKDVVVEISSILKTLVNSSKIQISQIMIDDEITRMFANLIDQTAKLGITIESYLKSQNKTLDTLKKEYKKQAEDVLKIDFILEKIAKEEKIIVTDKEVEDAISANPDPKAQEQLKTDNGKIYVKATLSKNKVLSMLSKLIK